MALKIVTPSGGELSALAAHKLKQYLETVSQGEVRVVPDSSIEASDGERIIIGGSDRNMSSVETGSLAGGTNATSGSYVLRTVDIRGDRCVVAAGRDEHGDKHAVYRLIRELPVTGDSWRVPDWDISYEPFIGRREVIMGDACPWDPFAYADEVSGREAVKTYDVIFNSEAAKLNCPDNSRGKVALRRIVEKYCIENWPTERLERYIDQMDAFGFNSIQYTDDTENYFHSGCLATRRQYREKLIAMMQRTRDLGDRVSFMTWGPTAWIQNETRVVSDWEDPLCDDAVCFKESYSVKDSKCWNEPQGRRMIEAHWQYFCRYMPFVDHLISHFYDPGGCSRNGCTIGTCMRIMNSQVATYRKVNPHLQATFNVWPLSSEHAGFSTKEVHSDVSRAWSRTFTWWNFTKAVRLLDPDIMVASRKYDPEIASLCKKWNRGYGLWSWYTSDQEITASLHVEAERLGREFRSLPTRASGDLEYVSVPSNCHGLNAAGLYVAARLMWEPGRDPFDMLREFCACVFGPKTCDVVYAGYRAIARIRNRDVNGDSAFSDDYLGAGTPDPDADVELSGQALAGLERAAVDEDWVPKIPVITDRAQMIEDLIDHVRMVHQYARFRERYLRLSLQERIAPNDWKKLPKIEKLRSSGGMIEWRKAANVMKLDPGRVDGGKPE